ncbi:hypothetical protein [Aliikangiella coralliicola]|uniref:PepSY domain-containing protein n=1 Tax=Aliikangiella coralliicola TaxID=2592383 RepID=A0A545U6A0_9GAMM|nr:hypothetical protein [Aliikangiella coralliicola]TQV84999.1 hypothetical protein FLL46_21660 [Aliikangiella coralliicola]
MKKLLALTLLLPLLTANAATNKTAAKAQVKSKSAQTKVFRNHERHWNQPDYGYDVQLFKCHDSWGHKLRGKFTSEQQYFIELGGGSCREIRRYHDNHNAFSQIRHYDFPVDDVYQAIHQIKRKYGLRHARVIEAENVDAGFKTFKYTLVFKVRGQGYREFRVKHSRWSGKVRAIYEV